MPLLFHVIEGPRKGLMVPIKAGDSVGRNQGAVPLHDHRVSIVHALVESGLDETLFLVDQKSKNGLVVNGERQDRIRLDPGVEIVVGKTTLRVEYSSTLPASESSFQMETEAATRNAPADSDPSIPAPENPFLKKEEDPWRGVIIRAIKAAQKEIRSGAMQTVPFPHPLKVSFIRGVQHGTEWILGYGPRTFGASSPDLPLLDPSAPEAWFSIEPNLEELMLVSKMGTEILVNGKYYSKTPFRDGDVVELDAIAVKITVLHDRDV